MKKHTHAAMQFAELAFVAPMVIAQRTARMSQPNKEKANQREASLMVREKMEASTESMVGVTLAAVRMQTQFAALLMRPWFDAGGVSGAGLASLMQASAADLSNSAVSPYLRKAKANAKRLGR
jgi:hypothetical protein